MMEPTRAMEAALKDTYRYDFSGGRFHLVRWAEDRRVMRWQVRDGFGVYGYYDDLSEALRVARTVEPGMVA